MSDAVAGKPKLGSIVWRDLTVTDAAAVRDFYHQVVGWEPSPVEMGDYDDYNMNLTSTGDTVAGICHARGENAKMPPQWLMYVSVPDAEAAAQKAVSLGGKIVDGPRSMGGSKVCIVQDPAGAVIALISSGTSTASTTAAPTTTGEG